ncbi:hypothetical protein PPUJ20005_03750 [Pseudomonas putida]|uniref:hypothetical protein n=1 Tax=Pseudomonas putida TaxID=303 RepID=UPI00235BECFE|nr:hypothetical protein [Pseudomonas putida]GLO06407.1 hypothetical protein PPUJ20005_03750 [Pseudomonas putida]HDS0986127.1 hypothetical protein [Pseudomonas putida]
MKKIKNQKFEEFRKLLIKNLPNHNLELSSIDIYLDRDGGVYNKGKLSLVKDDDLTCPIFSVAPSNQLNETDIDSYAQELAKHAFLYLAATSLTHSAVAAHFISVIKLAHNDIRVEDLPDRIEITYTSIYLMPKSSMFTISPDARKLVVIKDHILYEDIQKPWYENDTTYYSKYSEDNVISFASIIGMLSFDPPFSHSTKLYTTAFNTPMNAIIEIISALNPKEKSTSFQLKKKLVSLPTSLGKEYETVIQELIYYIFSNCYEEIEMFVQRANESRLRIRDIIIDNLTPKNNFLTHLNTCGVHYLLMDAKNYKNPLKPNEIDTFVNYIRESKRFGNFGIILSRKGASKSLKAQQIKMMREGIEIIILDDDDILNMVDLRAMNLDPISILKEKTRDLRLLA